MKKRGPLQRDSSPGLELVEPTVYRAELGDEEEELTWTSEPVLKETHLSPFLSHLEPQAGPLRPKDESGSNPTFVRHEATTVGTTTIRHIPTAVFALAREGWVGLRPGEKRRASFRAAGIACAMARKQGRGWFH